MRSTVATQALSEVTSVHLDDLRLNGGTQPRAEISEAIVVEYAEAMGRGEKLPPPIVFFDGTDRWLADGFHRVHAAKRLGRSFVLCEVRQGTWREAVLYSVGSNSTHGMPRTNADKRRAVQRLLDDPEWAKWADREIARTCKVDPKLVGSMRPLTEEIHSEGRTYTTKHGTEATMRTANIGARDRAFHGEREVPEHLKPLSEDDARRHAVVERHRPIIRSIEAIIETQESLPSVAEATREFPRGLRDLIDVKRVRKAAAWLTEFADALS